MRSSIGRSSLALVSVLALSSWAPARAEVSPIAKLVPSGVHLCIAGRADPARDELMAPFAKACRDLVDSGIGADLLDLVTSELPRHQREEARAVVHRVVGLLAKPAWGELVEREVAFALRVAVPIPEYLLLFRVSEANAEARRAELREMLQGFAQFAPEHLSVTDSVRVGAGITRLDITGAPFGLEVASKKDIVAISTSSVLLDSSMRLVDVGDGAGSVANDPRVAAALEGLETDGDTHVWFDLPGYLGFFRGMIGMVRAGAGQDQGAQAALNLADDVLEELGHLGPIGGVEAVRDGVSYSNARISFTPAGSPGFIEKLVANQAPVENIHRIVPAGSRGFWATAGVNPLTVYDGIVDLIRTRLPRGEQAIARYEEVQRRIGFDLRDDLLGWIDGGMGWISVPGRTPGTSESVFFLRVRDEEKPRALLREGAKRLEEFLESRGLEIDFPEIYDVSENFHEVRIEALPWLRPAVGVSGGVLVIASSADAVRKVAAVFKGESKSLADTDAMKALDLPERPLSEVYWFAPRECLGCIADLASTAGFVCSVLPRERGTRVPRKLGRVLIKLARFLRAVDLPVETAGWSYYDREKSAVFSQHTWRIAR